MSLPIGERAVNVARSKIGQREIGGQNKGPIVEWATQGLPVYQDTPRWCAYFVSQCYRLAAADEEEERAVMRFAHGRVSVLWTRLAAQDVGQPWTWLTPSSDARPTPEPKAGDLVFFGGLHHVRLVESFGGGWLHMIGGNEGNAVRRSRLPINDPTIHGFSTVRI